MIRDINLLGIYSSFILRTIKVSIKLNKDENVHRFSLCTIRVELLERERDEYQHFFFLFLYYTFTLYKEKIFSKKLVQKIYKKRVNFNIYESRIKP